jgi:hypothetical protein
MRTPLWAAAAFLLAADFAALAGEKKSAGDGAKTDADAVKAYLAKHYRGKKWQQGPTRLDTPEIRKAYGKLRFYFVYSSPPEPPGAVNKEILAEYARRFDDYRNNYMSLTVRIEGDKITPVQDSGGFNHGLMKVQSEADVKTAAAAILSLYGSFRVGPGPVSASAVKAARSGKGWSASVKERFFQGSVSFDAAGKCTGVMKFYAGPLPQ